MSKFKILALSILCATLVSEYSYAIPHRNKIVSEQHNTSEKIIVQILLDHIFELYYHTEQILYQYTNQDSNQNLDQNLEQNSCQILNQDLDQDLGQNLSQGFQLKGILGYANRIVDCLCNGIKIKYNGDSSTYIFIRPNNEHVLSRHTESEWKQAEQLCYNVILDILPPNIDKNERNELLLRIIRYLSNITSENISEYYDQYLSNLSPIQADSKDVSQCDIDSNELDQYGID